MFVIKDPFKYVYATRSLTYTTTLILDSLGGSLSYSIQHFQLLITSLIIITSVNELLKIKDELTKDRDEKLSEITKVLESLILFLL